MPSNSKLQRPNESFEDFVDSNIPNMSQHLDKVKLLYDVHNVAEFGYRTHDFFTKVGTVTEHCNKEKAELVLKSLDSLVKHDAFKDACKAKGLEGLQQLAKDPEAFVKSKGCAETGKLLEDFRKHANDKVFKAELVQTAFAFAQGAWVLHSIYKALSASNRLNSEFIAISGDITKFRESVEDFAEKVNKYLQQGEDQAVDFGHNEDLYEIHSEGLSLIELYKDIASRIENFKVSARSTIVTIRQLKQRAQENSLTATASVVRTGISHFATGGLQSSRFGMALGVVTLAVGAIGVAAQWFATRSADQHIEKIEGLVRKMVENETKLDHGHRRLLVAMGRIDPEFKSEVQRRYGMPGRA